ncbi:MAG: hypothetical protein GY744_00115 [Gammaproteobacteria bacterium]|nr:hypothetical protein [Gammaproteobacteria bacterium]
MTQTLSLSSLLSLYFVLTIMALYLIPLSYWQLMVLRGKPMENPDGSVDDWHLQQILYGMAFADLFVAIPVNIIGIILVFINPLWGYYALALVSFWWLWTGVMSTSTSLRFEKPKINLMWFIIFPFGALVGGYYIIWTIIHFKQIFML